MVGPSAAVSLVNYPKPHACFIAMTAATPVVCD
jgi:hypothetical protein